MIGLYSYICKWGELTNISVMILFIVSKCNYMKTEEDLFHFRMTIWTYNCIFLEVLKLINHGISSSPCRSFLRGWEMWTFCCRAMQDCNFSSSWFTRKMSSASTSNPDNTNINRTIPCCCHTPILKLQYVSFLDAVPIGLYLLFYKLHNSWATSPGPQETTTFRMLRE